MKTNVYTPDDRVRFGNIDFIWHGFAIDENVNSVTIPYLKHEIIFNFGDQFSVNQEPSTSVIFVSGLAQKPIDTEIAGEYHSVGLMLDPLYFFQRFGTSVFFENYPAFDLISMMGADVSNLYERIGNAETAQEKLTLTADYFHPKRFKSDIPAFVLRFLNSLQTDQLRKGRVSDTAASAGISSKHLIRTFRDILGCTPHQYQQLFYFNKALHTLHHDYSEHKEYLNAFFDQSHFSGTFRKFSGLTPSAYKKAAIDGFVQKTFPNTILLAG